MKTLTAIVVSTAIVFGGIAVSPAFSQQGHAGHDRGHASPANFGTESVEYGLSEGTVRRVNAAAGTVTIAHGPLVNLDMPPMTMSFRVSGEASLEGLGNGDRVRFAAGKHGREFVVTMIEKITD